MRNYTLSVAALLLILGQVAAKSDKHGAAPRKRRHLRSLANNNRLDPPFMEQEPPRFSHDGDSNAKYPTSTNMRAVGREIDRIQNSTNDREGRNGEGDGDDVEYDPDDGRPFDFDPINVPSKNPSSMPSPSPSGSPSLLVTESPSQSPSIKTTEASRVEQPQRTEICPLSQPNIPSSSSLWHIEVHLDSNPLDEIEDDLAEISSMVFSAQTDANGNRFAYAASDKAQFSVKVVKFGAQSKSGRVVATYTLKDVDTSQSDWEDMSLGPCSGNVKDTTTCIYVGDFGNNERPDYKVRKQLEIYKFPEPIFDAATGPTSQTVDVATIAYKYEKSKPLDAEAMFVDWNKGPGKGDIYILTKGSSCGHRLGVSRIPAAQHSNIIPGAKTEGIGEVEMAIVDPPDCANSGGHAWQGADMSRDGKLIALVRDKELANVHFFARDKNQTVQEALEAPPCQNVVQASGGGPNESKYEIVAFLDDFGNQMAVASECDGGSQCRVPLYVHTLEYEYTPADISFNNNNP
ncbi:MAG: hypothetical protein SGILL_004967 [Bacillariaceae sp.]